MRPTGHAGASQVSVYRCEFCGSSFLPLAKKINCRTSAERERERLQKVMEGETLLRIRGDLEVLSHGVSACSACHDSGLMWVEQASDAAMRTIFVDAFIRDVQRSSGQLHIRPLRVPFDASFPFPDCVAWRWRAEWAELNRADVADKLAKLTGAG